MSIQTPGTRVRAFLGDRCWKVSWGSSPTALDADRSPALPLV